MKWKMLSVTAVIALLIPLSVPADQYTYYPRNDFPIEDIDVQNGYFWFAAGYQGAVRYDPATGDYLIITEDDGLYHNDHVQTIEADTDGNIWFGMGAGVIKYDGETFTRYDYDTGLALSDFYDIYEDENGILWFGNWHGVFTWDGSEWTRYDQDDGLPRPPIKYLAAEPDGTIWAASSQDVTRFDGENWTTYKPPLSWNDYSNLEIADLFLDFEGAIWLGTNQGVMRFDGTEWTIYTVDDGLYGIACKALAQTPDGTIWAATGIDRWSRNVFSVFDGTSWSVYLDTNLIVSATIRTAYTDDSGTIWFGADNSELYYVRDGTLGFEHIESGVNSSWVFTVAVDHNNTVWFGNAKGVQSLDENGWRTFYRSDGLPEGYIRDLAVDHDGAVWAAADSGAARFDGDRWHPYTAGEGLAKGPVTSVSAAGNSVWFGTAHGISRLSNGEWMIFTTEDGLPGDYITCVYAEEGNVVWAGTNKGLSGFDGDSWKTFTTISGLPSDNVTVVCRDPRGLLWVGTMNGLASFDGSDWTTYYKDDGASMLPDNVIKAVTVDRTGRIWFGTDKGSAWFDGSSWGVDYKFDRVFDLAVDYNNDLWVTRSASDGKVLNYSLGSVQPQPEYPPGIWDVLTKNISVFNNMAVTEKYIWVPQQYSGIVRLDKTSGEYLLFSEEGGIGLTKITGVEIGANEDVWIISGSDYTGNNGILAYYNGNEWITVIDNLRGSFKNLEVDNYGDIWACHDAIHNHGSLGRWDAETGKELMYLYNYSIQTVFLSRDDTVWIGGPSFVYCGGPDVWLEGGDSFKNWTYHHPPEITSSVSSIAETSDGSMWFASLGRPSWEQGIGVVKYNGQEWSQYTIEDGLGDNGVIDMAGDKNNNLWVSTDKGISWYNGERWINLTIENSPLLRNDSNKIVVDDKGVVWIGSLSGLMSFTYDTTVAVGNRDETPLKFSLDSVYPNPFNVTATIGFTLEDAGEVTLSVYNIAGQHVRELKSQWMIPGSHSAVWDGRTDNGDPVSSGIYLAVLESHGRTVSRRMLLLK